MVSRLLDAERVLARVAMLRMLLIALAMAGLSVTLGEIGAAARRWILSDETMARPAAPRP